MAVDLTILEGTLSVLVGELDRLRLAMDQLTAGLKAALGTPGKPATASGGALPVKKGEDESGAIASVVGGLGKAAGALGIVVALCEAFVSSLDPALVEQLNWAMKNVVATIGVALRPVAVILVDVFRQLAGVLLPLTQALAPVLGELAGIMAEAIVPVVDAFADILTAMMPLIPPIMMLARALTSVVVFIAKITAVIITALAGLYEMIGVFDLIASVFKVLEDVVKGTIRALAIMIATIAKFFGGSEFVKAMAAKFQARPGEKGTPAVASAQNFQMSSVQDLLRAQQISAAKAVGGQVTAPQKTTENFLADIGDELAKIAVDGKTFMDLIETLIEAVKMIPGQIAAFLKEKATAAIPGQAHTYTAPTAPTTGQRLEDLRKQLGFNG